MSAVRWMMTDRGFKHYEAVQASAGLVEVYESSAAESPHLWVAVDGDIRHLTLDRAAQMRDMLAPDDARLREVLTVAIERHYQVFVPDPGAWKPGDQCVLCGSTDTGLEDDIAFCRGCGAIEAPDPSKGGSSSHAGTESAQRSPNPRRSP